METTREDGKVCRLIVLCLCACKHAPETAHVVGAVHSSGVLSLKCCWRAGCECYT